MRKKKTGNGNGGTHGAQSVSNWERLRGRSVELTQSGKSVPGVCVNYETERGKLIRGKREPDRVTVWVALPNNTIAKVPADQVKPGTQKTAERFSELETRERESREAGALHGAAVVSPRKSRVKK